MTFSCIEMNTWGSGVGWGDMKKEKRVGVDGYENNEFLEKLDKYNEKTINLLFSSHIKKTYCVTFVEKKNITFNTYLPFIIYEKLSQVLKNGNCSMSSLKMLLWAIRQFQTNHN